MRPAADDACIHRCMDSVAVHERTHFARRICRRCWTTTCWTSRSAHGTRACSKSGQFFFIRGRREGLSQQEMADSQLLPIALTTLSSLQKRSMRSHVSGDAKLSLSLATDEVSTNLVQPDAKKPAPGPSTSATHPNNPFCPLAPHPPPSCPLHLPSPPFLKDNF